MHANKFQIGLFDECRKFSHENIRGKYCIAATGALNKVVLPNNMLDFNSYYQKVTHQQEFKQGICVPKECYAGEVMHIGNKVLKNVDLQWYDVTCFEQRTLDNFDNCFL